MAEVRASMRSPYRTGQPVAGALGRTAPLFLALASLLLWARALPEINLRAMNGLGLVSVLPPLIFGALALLTISFALALRPRQPSTTLLLGHVLILIGMLYGITAVIQEVPRFALNWKLSGIVDHIMRTGAVDPTIDAFFNWPGFFILNAFVTQIAGLTTPLSFAAWAHLFFNLLYLGPLLLLFRSATDDRRLLWAGIWFFYVANWIGQDYLAPQAFGYFCYLVTLAVLVRWFSPQAAPLDPGQRVGLMTILIMLFVVLVPSHQLTPFAILASVSALVLFKRIQPRGLPILMAVIAATWISFMTVPFLSGHIETITAPVGAIGENVEANVGKRVVGSDQHIFIVYTRLVTSAGLWALAFLGGLRRLRHRYWDWTFALLGVVPFGLLLLQTYGGELLLRVYLFSLPAMGFFVAALCFPSPRTTLSWRTTGAVVLTTALLLVGFHFARYGNEVADFYTRDEVQAMHYLYEVAQPDDLLLAGTSFLPWQFQGYATYRHVVTNKLLAGDVDELADRMAHASGQAFFILTRSQKAAAEHLYGIPPDALDAFERALLSSGKFRLIYLSQDAKIFVLEVDGEADMASTADAGS